MISIHASRGGSDESMASDMPISMISIHASRGGSDCVRHDHDVIPRRFQSTLPVGEATVR